MTHPTDEELDVLVKRLKQLEGRMSFQSQNMTCARTCHLSADAITTLRTRLAEALNEVFDFPDRKAMSRRIREQRKLIRKLQVESDALHKLLRGGNSRADRAEAALAAQIEADAAKYGPHTNEGMLPNLGLQPGDRVVRVTGHDKWSDPDIGSEYTFCINSNYQKGVPHLIKDRSGWTTMTEKGTFRVIDRKPHDRTALDRMLAEAEERGYEIAKAEAARAGWHLRRYDLAKRDAELANAKT